jgi:Phage integrase, N-terminal SAM-like domain
VRRFIRFHGLRHPRELGQQEITAFLSDLATEHGVSASTQNQALCALLFLYRHVLGAPFPWLDNLQHAKRPVRSLRLLPPSSRIPIQSKVHSDESLTLGSILNCDERRPTRRCS